MLSFLDPRLWLAFLLAVALSSGASYFKGRSDGRQICEAKQARAAVLATADAFRRTEILQRNADKAARDASAREARLRADAARARRSANGLRDDLNAAREYAKESRAAAERVAATATGLLGRCTEAYLGVAQDAARADSEARTLRQAWPK